MHAVLSLEKQKPNYKNLFLITSAKKTSGESVNKTLWMNNTSHIVQKDVAIIMDGLQMKII